MLAKQPQGFRRSASRRSLACQGIYAGASAAGDQYFLGKTQREVDCEPG